MRVFEEIASVFRAEGVEDFMKLPESVEACRKFAKLFSELNDFLEAAKSTRIYMAAAGILRHP